MSEITLLKPQDLMAFVDIVADAYPGMELSSEEERNRVKEQLEKIYDDDHRQLIGLYRDGKLLGGMILHDFDMQVHSSRLNTGGVGLVAVHFLHKKEKVAKEMIEYFLRHYRMQGAALTSLYPFRPDFYRKMGYGYGPKIGEYRVLPTALPRGSTRKNIKFVDVDDSDDLLNCYNRYAGVTHGMIFRRESDIERVLFRSGNKVVAFHSSGELDGYLAYSFEKGETFIENDIIINELIYNSPQALSELLSFLHTQLDQVRRIVFRTYDEDFHHLLSDPRNDSRNLIPHVCHETNTGGLGLMYRVIDSEAIFGLLGSNDFGGQSCLIEFDVHDDFLPENDAVFKVEFINGHPSLAPTADPEVKVNLDIVQFSSLIMGTARFRKLHDYGLAHISDDSYISVLDRLFKIDQQPICMTFF